MNKKEERDAWVQMLLIASTAHIGCTYSHNCFDYIVGRADMLLDMWKEKFGEEAFLREGLGKCNQCDKPLGFDMLEVEGGGIALRFCSEECKEESRKAVMRKMAESGLSE